MGSPLDRKTDTLIWSAAHQAAGLYVDEDVVLADFEAGKPALWQLHAAGDKADANLYDIVDPDAPLTIAGQGTGVGSGVWIRFSDAPEILEETTARATGSDFPANRKQTINNVTTQIYVKNASGKSDFNRERNLGIYDVANYADHYDEFGVNGNSADAAQRAINTDALNAALADARAKGDSARICLPRSFDMDGELLINRPHWHVFGSSDIEIGLWGGSIKIDGDSYGDWMRGCKVSNLNIRRRATAGPAIEVLNNGADVGPTFNSPILMLLEDLRILSVPAGSDGIHWKGGFQGQINRCYIGDTGTTFETGLVIDTISGNPGGVSGNALEINGGEVKSCKLGFSVRNSFKVGFSDGFVVQGNSEAGGLIGEGNVSVHIDNCYFEKNGTNPAAAATDQNCALIIGDDNALAASTTRNTTITNSVFFGGPLDHAIVVNKADGVFLRDNFFGGQITHSVFNKRPTFTTGKMSGGGRADTVTPNDHINGDIGNTSLTYLREAQPTTYSLTTTEWILQYENENGLLRAPTANTVHPVTIPNASTNPLPLNYECRFFNQAGGATTVITPAAGVQLRQEGGALGAYTHTPLYGVVTIRQVQANIWVLF